MAFRTSPMNYADILLATNFKSMAEVPGKVTAPIDSLLDENYPSSHLDLVRIVYVQILERDQEAPSAERCHEIAVTSLLIVEWIAQEIGGGQIYIQKSAIPGIRDRLRNEEILKDFNGQNFRALARKHGVSEMRVRQILSAAIKRIAEPGATPAASGQSKAA